MLPNGMEALILQLPLKHVMRIGFRVLGSALYSLLFCNAWSKPSRYLVPVGCSKRKIHCAVPRFLTARHHGPPAWRIVSDTGQCIVSGSAIPAFVDTTRKGIYCILFTVLPHARRTQNVERWTAMHSCRLHDRRDRAHHGHLFVS